MGLTMREKHSIIRELAPKFQHAAKKERGRILDRCVEITGYTRCYAAYALRHCGSERILVIGGKRVVFIPGHARAPGARRNRSQVYYQPGFFDALKFLWALSDGLCGKRLVAFIRETLPELEQRGSIKLPDQATREALLRVSPATVDRHLTATRTRVALKGRSTTRPGTLLKHHIAVRTFADWNEQTPGFCEVDLVAHDGGVAFGDFAQTLTVTDVATGWTEPRVVKNKAQCHVFTALKDVRNELPFPLLGIDSDNGGEFINNQLYRYCIDERITFTRSRAYRKNDNCFVEQKNYSVVRRTVAYYRYDTQEQLELLQGLYALLRLYINFFQPVMKLKEKVRTGSRVTRRYDAPQTPYRRLLEHPSISDDIKQALRDQYRSLDLVQLKRELNHLQARLFNSALARPAPPPPQINKGGYAQPNHPWRHSKLRGKSKTCSVPSTPPQIEETKP
ncbi:MAG TPA: transposase family protein [Bacteroidota bacterium]